MRQVTDGRVRLAVLGDCGASSQDLQRALAAVRAGRWWELTRWPGAYWVVAESGGHRFVCGDLAGLRPVYYTLRGAPGAPGGPVRWATDAALLGYPLVADLPYLVAHLVVGGHHWPHRTAFEEIRAVPGGFGLLLEPSAPPRLIEVSRVEPVDELREGAARFGQALTDAVQHRVRHAGASVSADLSGGLDSSTAVLLAAAAGDVHAVTYTDGYTSAEDSSFAARVAAHAYIRHTSTEGEPRQLPFTFPPRAEAGGEPVFALANWAMDAAYLAPVAALPAHVTGHGGDTVLDASSACWVRLLQEGRRREAHRQVVAFARLRNTAPGPYWKTLKQAAELGRTGALERAGAVLERGPLPAQGAPAGWAWCRLGVSATWLTEQGRLQVAALLRQAARDQPSEHADTFDEWAALRAMGASARGWAPYAQTLGITPVYPYLDNEVVRAAFAVPALARRGLTAYKPLLRAALPQLPDWLTSRRSKGSFTAQRIAGLARHYSQLEELITSSPLAADGLIDPDAVRDALGQAARGQNATAIAHLHQLAVTCWWLTGQMPRREVAAC
ncbi:asparagine synthase-related protein [Streptomyces venezuelae]|nr:asparagine synthase-related protein [Streptomyces venezuelae]